MFRDITERKQAEETLHESQTRLSGIIDSAMDAIITVDEAQTILFFNPAAARMFGYSGETMLGQSLDRLIPERVRVAHREHVQHFGQRGVTMRAMGALGALHGLRADGEEFPVEASISQIVVAGEKLYTVILRDISEQQRAVQAIQALNELLEQRVQVRTAELMVLNKELEAFSYSVSHDLRAPLRNVAGFIELFTKSVGQQLSKDPQRYLTIISDETKRMGVLIDDLLAFSRIGRVELQKTAVDLTRLIQEVQTSLQLETQGREIAWQIGELPQVYADRALLRQVLINLMANALKFTRPRAQAKIEIGVLPTPADEPMVVVFIRDNGVGFDMKYNDKLFNVFQRLHRAEEFEGTGVGLAIVQRIIHRHGGRVWAEAAVEQGATFFVALPQKG
jgi:PAS domain S-box-containing protein